ncbi:MAG TPA: FAD-dependent oxidoreductase [Geminicoccus sp.]|jgi:2-polyprenyl-6-methoxyphenol hydroxylase-like FAD-dependent oxidoreductase|uniref:FAD-dependent oxidoreductase n=1 Tax=Geminicoccus sp. TaxID=2024832 RepID=UPI002E347883|nr:FAD-dependent oxidoreductase [Geminicoccus sp.]HEX2529447.1 FAD-dependent oxidoreductase [Geminicoccus sp.]
MALPQRCDVLIVGAGPTGMALAAELARRGVRSVLIVDRLVQGANESRAGVIHARTLEVLEPLDVVPDLMAEGLPTTAFRARDRDRVLLSMNFAALPSRYQFILMCPQDRTEHVLRRKLTELGQSIVRPCNVQELAVAKDGVDAKLEVNGAIHDVRAAWVVGCDGGRSIVRQSAGIAFEGDSYEQSFILADIHMDWPLGPTEGSLFFSPDGLAVIAPFRDGRYRVVATVDQAPEQPGVELVQAILQARGPTAPTAMVRDVLWSSRFRIHHRVAATFRQDRVLICGDAAHVHSPAGGQGMNTGIQDAVSLGEPLMAALSTGDQAGLAAWAMTRRANALRLIAMTDRLTRVATARSPAARALRNAAFRTIDRLQPVKQRIAIALAQLDRR